MRRFYSKQTKKEKPSAGGTEGLLRRFAELHRRREGDRRSIVEVLAFGAVLREEASKGRGEVPRQPRSLTTRTYPWAKQWGRLFANHASTRLRFHKSVGSLKVGANIMPTREQPDA